MFLYIFLSVLAALCSLQERDWKYLGITLEMVHFVLIPGLVTVMYLQLSPRTTDGGGGAWWSSDYQYPLTTNWLLNRANHHQHLTPGTRRTTTTTTTLVSSARELWETFLQSTSVNQDCLPPWKNISQYCRVQAQLRNLSQLKCLVLLHGWLTLTLLPVCHRPQPISHHCPGRLLAWEKFPAARSEGNCHRVTPSLSLSCSTTVHCTVSVYLSISGAKPGRKEFRYRTIIVFQILRESGKNIFLTFKI